MTALKSIVDYCDQRLNAAEFEDYCPNGLQLEASEQVTNIVSGVTASLALIEAAAEQGADLLLVHHGFFWKGEAAPLTGMKGRRVRKLFERGISLLAYHLPLDAHPQIGNNARLGSLLGFEGAAVDDGKGLLWTADLDAPLQLETLSTRLAEVLQREPLMVGDAGSVSRVGWCTGAAQGYLEQAALRGCDVFISGEISESSLHIARELGLVYISAGHHATERYGVQALGDELATRFNLQHQFIDIANPV